MAGLQRLVDAAKDKNHPTVKDSAAAIAEHAALVELAKKANRLAFKHGTLLEKESLIAMRQSLNSLAAARREGGLK